MPSIEFSGTGNQGVAFSTSASLHNSSTFAIMFWFNFTDNSSGNNFATVYNDSGSFPVNLSLTLKQDGSIDFKHRDSGSTNLDMSTATGFDDSAWHTFVVLRRGATDYEMYVDGNSQATGSTNIGTGTVTTTDIGNPSSNNVPAANSKMSQFITTTDSITIDRALAALHGHISFNPTIYAPLGLATTDPDYSGNGYDGTHSAGMNIVSAGPPILNPWGFNSTNYHLENGSTITGGKWPSSLMLGGVGF